MNNKVLLTYFFLSLFVILSAVLLAKQIQHYLYYRQDPLVDVRTPGTDPDSGEQLYRENKQQEMKSTLLVFRETQSFQALATPIPQPTPTPIPPPSPTPVVPARGYTIIFATANSVSLRKYDGSTVFVRVGDTVKEELWGDFKIISTKPDFKNPQVEVQHVASGARRTIAEQAPKK
jgi:hypothetical protein